MSYECSGTPNSTTVATLTNITLIGVTCDLCYQAGLDTSSKKPFKTYVTSLIDYKGSFNCLAESPCQVSMDEIAITSFRGFECSNVIGTVGSHVRPKPCY